MSTYCDIKGQKVENCPWFFYLSILFPNIMESKNKFRPDRRLKLMDQVRQVMRYHHYAYRTEKTYIAWIRSYIKYFGDKYHPKGMEKTEVEAFLSHLAVKENVSALSAGEKI